MSLSTDRLELHLKYLFEYGINLKTRVITLVGDIDDTMFERLEAGLSELESYNHATITIRLNSEGGSVYDGLAIVGRIKASKAKKIVIEGYGQIMSAATLILSCGDERRLSEHAWVMFHETAHHSEEGAVKRTSQLKHELAQEIREHAKWCEAMEEFTDKPKEYWLKQGVGKDAYFSPDEALELGMIDEII